MSESFEAILTIENELGLHARAATLFVQVASQYKAEVFVAKDGREANGKSIMGILTLVAAKGSQIAVRAEGEDAEQAVMAIAELVASKFMESR
jgi:phosphocarrier protein